VKKTAERAEHTEKKRVFLLGGLCGLGGEFGGPHEL